MVSGNYLHLPLLSPLSSLPPLPSSPPLPPLLNLLLFLFLLHLFLLLPPSPLLPLHPFPLPSPLIFPTSLPPLLLFYVSLHLPFSFPSSSSDVMFFQKWLGRYRLEHIQAKNCPAEKDLGLILIDSQELKEQLLPSPLRCLEVRQVPC